jgi:glycosyltransferase involved in cell wall biosynthesis
MTDGTSAASGELPPLFTIAIPTFNRAPRLRACVAAALSQSWEDFEVVVSDNASSDDTLTVLNKLAHARLRVLRQETNIGPTANWNACLHAARGTYVVFVSDDDLIAPHFLSRCGRLIDHDGRINVIVALGDVVTPATGHRRPAVKSRRLRTGVIDGLDVLQEFLSGRISPQMCTVMIRVDALRSRGGFPANWPHTGDLVSWVPLLLFGRAGFVNESCGSSCTHAESQTSQLALETIICDICKLADAISGTAGEALSDRGLVEKIRSHTRQYAARHILGHIATRRKNGTRLRDLLPTMIRWRNRLRYAAVADLFQLAIPVAVILLPQSVTRLVARVKRTARDRHLERVN